jgi:predicted outer membrane repeat protein
MGAIMDSKTPGGLKNLPTNVKHTQYQGPRTIYVDADAAGKNNGSNWANACCYLQNALAIALAGDEIRVAEGVYTPDAGLYLPSPPPNLNRATFFTFQLKNGVTLKGSYAGFGQPDPNQRNIRKYETILSGDPKGDDLYISSPHNWVEWPGYNDNAFHVVTFNQTDQNTILDGFTITGGYNYYGSSSIPSGSVGAGLYNDSGSPTIRNCTITRNSAEYGAGVYTKQGNPTFINCIFSANRALYRSCGFGSDCLLFGEGGAIYCASGSITLINSSIIRNQAGSEGGAIYCRGNCSLIINNCIIWHNSPDQISTGNAQYSISITYSNIQGGWQGPGNINSDPLLTWDGHLRAGSPCINTADPNYFPDPAETDIDSEIRIKDGRVDMGSDEFLDSDSDTLPDWWEAKYFNDPITANPADDPDADGWTNLDEYVNYTLPDVQPVTYYVDPKNGYDSYDGLAPQWDGLHGPKRTIYRTVDMCRPRHNDIVTLLEGTHAAGEPMSYYTVDFNGKALTLRSMNPADPRVVAATIVRARPRVFNFSDNESPATLIDGLTITGGYVISCSGQFPPEYGICGEPVGGAILCRYASPTIKRCLITGNYAGQFGGAIYIEHGSPTITDCIITDNSSGVFGGAISCGTYEQSGGSPIIQNCIIAGNSAFLAAIECWESTPTIANCIITGNSAYYGVVYNFCSRAVTTKCTIVGNTGAGVFCYGSDASIINCIIRQNEPNQIIARGCEPIVAYSDVQSGWPGLGNIDVDPCFVRPGYWDPNGTPDDANDDFWVDGDYHLKSEGWCWDSTRNVWTWDDVTSRCIDAGNPGSPLGDEPFTIPIDPNNQWGRNIRIDMGAYGGTAEASIPPHNWALLADLTNDGIVDLVDFAYSAENWLITGSDWPGDLDRNAVVDLADFALFADDWLEETTWHR